jgi:hypothetical protein
MGSRRRVWTLRRARPLRPPPRGRDPGMLPAMECRATGHHGGAVHHASDAPKLFGAQVIGTPLHFRWLDRIAR